jgi:hypothetical protein
VGIRKPGPSATVKTGKAQVKWDNVIKKVFVTITGNKAYLIDIMRLNGKTAISRKVQGPGRFIISIPDLYSGVYQVKIYTESGMTRKTITTVK